MPKTFSYYLHFYVLLEVVYEFSSSLCLEVFSFESSFDAVLHRTQTLLSIAFWRLRECWNCELCAC